MNYTLGDFGATATTVAPKTTSSFNFSSLLNQGITAGQSYLSNPANQQSLINAGLNLIAPKPPKPKTPSAISPSSPAAVAAAAAKDNTMLYIGLGVAGVTVLAIVAGIIMSRKK